MSYKSGCVDGLYRTLNDVSNAFSIVPYLILTIMVLLFLLIGFIACFILGVQV